MIRRSFLALINFAAFADGAEVYRDAFARGLRPETKLTVSEWADQNRFLTTSVSSQPGEWRTTRVPYLREVMDALSPSHPCESVTLRKGSQLGGTEAGNNWVGYIIDKAPGPVLIVLPTDKAAKKWSKQRLTHLIFDSPAVRRKVSAARMRDGDNTQYSKKFTGGILFLAGANSPTELRSMPARYVFFDEVDAYPGDVGGEGDPVYLAEKRQETFRNRKSFKCSTPTDHATSRIDRHFDAGDQRHYFVPCPKCGHYQTLVFHQLQYWPKDNPEGAAYKCIAPACGELIEERFKTQMLESGVWVPTASKPELAETGFAAAELGGLDGLLATKGTAQFASFHLPSLYSPVGWLSWLSIAQQWVKAQRDQTLLKAFLNTVLAESWKERTEAPDPERLYGRRETTWALGRVPRGVLLLTAGVDVQADRLVVQVKGWGVNKENWVVDWFTLTGRPSDPETWRQLSAWVGGSYPCDGGGHMTLAKVAIDSGFSTSDVYQWARSQNPLLVMVVKGQESGSAPLGTPSAVDLKTSGKYSGERIRRGLKVWPVATSLLKGELYGWLNQAMPEAGGTYPPGYVHYPELDLEFFRELTAERLQTRQVRGYDKREWVKARERNEALDTHVYARAAAAAAGIDRFRPADWQRLEAMVAQMALPMEETAAEMLQPQATVEPDVAPGGRGGPVPIAMPKPKQQPSKWIARGQKSWFQR